MIDDPIVQAVREIRDELARAFQYDVHLIFEDLRSRERRPGSHVIEQPKLAQTRLDEFGLSKDALKTD